MIEELGGHITTLELSELFESAADLVTYSQQPETLMRLIDCARRILPTQSSALKRPLRVFLCHAKDDKPEIRGLYKRLLSENIDAWLDEEKLLAGQDWDMEIAKAVRTSDIVIVCLSNKSTNKAGFVQKEIKYALDVADQQPEGAIFLIPLKLEDCAVPERLSNRQWLNFYEVGGFTRLLNSLHRRAIDLNLSIPKRELSRETPNSMLFKKTILP